jgi:hypothetical protein
VILVLVVEPSHNADGRLVCRLCLPSRKIRATNEYNNALLSIIENKIPQLFSTAGVKKDMGELENGRSRADTYPDVFRVNAKCVCFSISTSNPIRVFAHLVSK